MPRFEHKATIIDYNEKDWPEITGVFGITSDLVDGMSVISRSHTNTIDQTEQWAKNTARIDNKPIKWRVFERGQIGIKIIACGIEYPPTQE